MKGVNFCNPNRVFTEADIQAELDKGYDYVKVNGVVVAPLPAPVPDGHLMGKAPRSGTPTDATPDAPQQPTKTLKEMLDEVQSQVKF